jgi:putative DNA primase/helicase
MRGRGNDEAKQIRQAVASFIERHGDSRFSEADREGDAIRVNRAGWFEDSMDGRVFLFNADGLREALKGFDFRRALDVLEQAGAIPKAGANGERARLKRIGGRAVKLYPITAGRLEVNNGP